MRFVRFSVFQSVSLLALFALPLVANAQLKPRFDLHDLRPGMTVQDAKLRIHSKLDTVLWGGADGASILSFRGEFLNDTGEFRLATLGQQITQVTFISRPRTVEQNKKLWDKTVEKLRGRHGKPSEEYHNKYQIISWDGNHEQLRLTTSDGGKFYSIALSDPMPSSAPSIR